MKTQSLLLVQTALIGCLLYAPAHAQETPASPDSGATASTTKPGAEPATDQSQGDIVVTAQRRSESINRVPMSITAESGAQLQQLGVQSTPDLIKVIPSLTLAQSPYGTPVYSLRGVGFYDTAIASSSAVAVYTDEVPIPLTLESTGLLFDLERVEVLKGPQGTLFGQNSTGGAINFISAKPTDELHYGADLSYGRFGAFVGSAYITGKLSDTLKIRIAGKTEQGGAWQRSVSRDDSLGNRNLTSGRFIVDWTPISRLKIELTVNGWTNKSDTQAAQFVLAKPLAPVPAPILSYPTKPFGDRAADWNANTALKHDDDYIQTSARITYDLADNVQLTSITSYNHLKANFVVDIDGTPFADPTSRYIGRAHSFYEELRLSGTSRLLTWQIGANYEKSRVFEEYIPNYPDSTAALALNLTSADYYDTQKPETKAVFGQAEFAMTSKLSIQAGIRYTKATRDFSYCSVAPTAAVAAYYQGISNRLRTAQGLPIQTTPIGVGSCTTLDSAYLVGAMYSSKLSEDNVSWRGGVTWKPSNGTLLYFNASRGYKAGSFPQLSAQTTAQLAPVKQESILAYEGGFKVGLFDRSLQLNGAVFRYDYTNKQFFGSVADPLGVLGFLRTLVNIPHSRVNGAELQAQWRPVAGLAISGSATYVDAKVDRSFVNFDILGNRFDFKGLAFPLTPRWSADTDIDYRHRLSPGLTAFIGAHVNYSEGNLSAFSSPTDPRSADFRVPSRTLLDLRAGVEKDNWRVTLWGRNVTNKFYWTSVFAAVDTVSRVTGMPATYGVDLALKF